MLGVLDAQEAPMAHATPGHFVWYDHLTRDPKGAIAFYAHVFGWTSQPMGESGYTLFAGSQGPMAGTYGLTGKGPTAGAPPHWTANVYVADVDATAAEVQRLGGSVVDGPNDFPGVGRLAVIADPMGVRINLFRPARPTTLHDRTRPGEFTWHELLTTDHESAFAFYSAIFGWKKSRDFDMGPMGKYVIYGIEGADLGGMMTKPKDMPAPPHWLFYVQVAELEAAIERARSKGAKLLNGPEQVPGGARIAQLTDPDGAAFALHEPAKT
jgi:predicted enzyme related to lactoylglutathione lyase